MKTFASWLQTSFTWCDRNILLPVTLFFVAGTYYGCQLSPALPEIALYSLLILLTLTALILFFRRHRAALFLILPIFFLTGYSNAVHRLQEPMEQNHIHSLITTSTRATLVGTVASMVEQRDNSSRFELSSREILLHNGRSSWQPVHGQVLLSIPMVPHNLKPGALVMVAATLRRPSISQSPGAFDYKTYLAARNIHVTGWIRSDQDIIQVQGTTSSLWSRFAYLPEQVRQKVAGFIRLHLDPKQSGLYQALLIGSRAEVAPDLLEQFKATGTMHLLAISGLHMGLLGLMAGTLLNLLLRRSQWLLLHTHVPSLALAGTLPILLAYGFIAGMNPPVFRALIMAMVLMGAIVVRRPHTPLHLVATAALFMLALNPLALFTASFQLSFSAVTGLALFLPYIAPSVVPDTLTNKPETKLYGFIKTGLLVSITATAATLPFMLFHFNRFSTIGPLMNLLIEPLLCFWALPWGLAAIPMIYLSPQLGAALLNTGALGIDGARFCTEMAGSLPWASIRTITPTAMEMLGFGLLLVLLRVTFHSPGGRLSVILGSALLILHFTWTLWFPAKLSESRVSFLDVGQGTSSFLHLPDGERILIDGGGAHTHRYNVGERVIGPFLRNTRIWRLNQIVITHPHSDHFNGLDFILRHFRPDTLIINGDPRTEGMYNEIIKQAADQGTQVKVAAGGDSLVDQEQWGLSVLGMNGLIKGRQASVNDASLVLKYRHGQRAFLFPGDTSARSEQLLVDSGGDLDADVLLAAHHGSVTSNSNPFMDAVSPKVIVVSAGKNGQAYYPYPPYLSRWHEQDIPVYITRDQGSVTCTTNGSKLSCAGYAGGERVISP